MKDPATYEHVAPESVGNKRKLLVSDQAGRSNLLAELDRIGLAVEKDDPRLVRLLDQVKEHEAIGYAYEAADASFELLARRLLGKVPRYFDVEKFDVNVEHRLNAKGERVTVSQAVVKVRVGDELLISAAEGNGPVNALDLALRKDLGKYQKFITGLELTDYRVRILNAGTEAVTRVLIESIDENGDHWTTIGVSPNIIDASFQALMDSIIYKLIKSGAPVLKRGSRHDRSHFARGTRSKKSGSILRGRAGRRSGRRNCANGRMRRSVSARSIPSSGSTCAARWIGLPTIPACIFACARRIPLRSMRSTSAALKSGGSSDGEPGLRPHYYVGYYAAFVIDPDGNKIEAVTFLGEQAE